MKKIILSAVTVITLILTIPLFLIGCDKKQNPASSNSEKSENSAVMSGLSSSLSLSPSVKSSLSSSNDSSKSIFDIMKEENLDVVSTNDPNPERVKLLQKFFDEAHAIYYDYYKEAFIKSIDNKEIYDVELCFISKDENANYYTWGTSVENSNGISNYYEFNAIRSTGQEDEYIIFDIKKPNQNAFEHEKCITEISGVHIVIKNNLIVKFKTPIGDYICWDTSMDAYINQKQLIGNYQDQDGESYQFTEEEEAIWPDRKFKYSLFDVKNYDGWMYWDDCNPICVMDPETKKPTETYYGYKFVKDEMYIYEMIAGQPWGYHPEDNPILILHKVE